MATNRHDMWNIYGYQGGAEQCLKCDLVVKYGDTYPSNCPGRAQATIPPRDNTLTYYLVADDKGHLLDVEARLGMKRAQDMAYELSRSGTGNYHVVKVVTVATYFAPTKWED